MVAKDPLKNFIKLLSLEEKKEVLSGQWLGFAADKDITAQSKQEKDMQKANEKLKNELISGLES